MCAAILMAVTQLNIIIINNNCKNNRAATTTTATRVSIWRGSALQSKRAEGIVRAAKATKLCTSSSCNLQIYSTLLCRTQRIHCDKRHLWIKNTEHKNELQEARTMTIKFTAFISRSL